MNKTAQGMTFVIILLVVGLMVLGLQTNMNGIIERQQEKNSINTHDSLKSNIVFEDKYRTCYVPFIDKVYCERKPFIENKISNTDFELDMKSFRDTFDESWNGGYGFVGSCGVIPKIVSNYPFEDRPLLYFSDDCTEQEKVALNVIFNNITGVSPYEILDDIDDRPDCKINELMIKTTDYTWNCIELSNKGLQSFGDVSGK